jgi:MarR family transcriptional regulator, organic hydroperoxide resistance regulator
MDDPKVNDVELWPAIRASPFDHLMIAPVFGAFHSVRHRLELATREHGLDATEAMVLDTIRRDPLCPPWSIRRRLGFHRSTLSSILDRLERDGHITRAADSFTGQRFEVRLTTSGQIAAELGAFAIGAVEDEIAGYTSPLERQAAYGVFEACVAVDRPGRR